MKKSCKLVKKLELLLKQLNCRSYLHRFGPKKYKLKHHLLALLLMQAYKLSLRRIESLLNMFEIKCPTYSALCKRRKKIPIDFIVGEDKQPEIYVGKIIIKYGDSIQEIPVAISLSSKKSLFDVDIIIDEEHREVFQDSQLLTEIKLFNFGAKERIDAIINYAIYDSDGRIIYSSQDTMAVQTQISFIKRFDISNEYKPGKYTVGVLVVYEGEKAGASEWFEVKGRIYFSKREIVILSIVSLLFFLVLFLLYKVIKIKKLDKTKEIRQK